MTTTAPAPPNADQGELTAGAGIAEWALWSTRARLVVTDPRVLGAARRLVDAELGRVAAAADRFDAGSEICSVCAAEGEPVVVSPILAALLRAALDAAGATDGDVDPTLGGALQVLGYDRDLAEVQVRGGHQVDDRALGLVIERPPWRSIEIVDEVLRLPPGLTLDLGATAKAWAADRCAATVAERLGVGVLVSLGGDIATAGPAPRPGGWQIRVQDRLGDPVSTVRVRSGSGLATSSTAGRTWRSGGHELHHILDPRTCRPAEITWRTATVAASSALRANTLSTAALVRGWSALPWLRDLGVAARLVRAENHEVIHIGAWPVGSVAA